MPDKYDLQKPRQRTQTPKTASNSPKSQVQWQGYINIPLVEADKRHYFQWRGQADVAEDIKEAILRDGFKLSVDFQSREEAFRASLYCQNPKLAEAGYCLSIFASSPGEAESRLLYVHAVKAQYRWEKWIGRKPDSHDWEEFRD